jgi:hypothetical protein
MVKGRITKEDGMSLKITIEATAHITSIDGVPVRLWEGVTENGTPCKVFIHRIAAREADDGADLARELRECLPPGHAIRLGKLLPG